MRLDREGKRVVAQFINGLAVSVIGIGAVTPIVAGQAPWGAVVAVSLGAFLGLAAVWVARR